jgi:hypothetical protein
MARRLFRRGLPWRRPLPVEIVGSRRGLLLARRRRGSVARRSVLRALRIHHPGFQAGISPVPIRVVVRRRGLIAASQGGLALRTRAFSVRLLTRLVPLRTVVVPLRRPVLGREAALTGLGPRASRRTVRAYSHPHLPTERFRKPGTIEERWAGLLKTPSAKLYPTTLLDGCSSAISNRRHC